jgi:hypothetical protein
MRTTPRIVKATEKYIASIGTKREELTEEQWNFMLNYVKMRHLRIPLLMILGLFCAGMTLAYWHLGHKYFTNALPDNTIKIEFNGQKEAISLSSEEVRKYFSYVTHCYMNAGVQFMLALQFLVFAILGATLTRTTNRKMHRILLYRPSSTEVEI